MDLDDSIKQKIYQDPPPAYENNTICPSCNRTKTMYRFEDDIFVCACCWILRTGSIPGCGRIDEIRVLYK